MVKVLSIFGGHFWDERVVKVLSIFGCIFRVSEYSRPCLRFCTGNS